MVLLVELLLALFGGCFRQLVSSIDHFLPLITSYAPYIAEVPEVLDGVIFL